MTSRTDTPWLARDAAERKVLITAMEEGFVHELLGESFVVLPSGTRRDYPVLSLETARRTVRGLLDAGLIGTFVLDGHGEQVGDEAWAALADDAVWTTPGSRGLCLFLTDSGDAVVGRQ